MTLRIPAYSRGAGRFAPTPTGDLHLGNARTAVLAHLAARKEGLRTILRVEDLDPKAIPSGCLENQYADLEWLGLEYDEAPGKGGPAGPYRQSARYAQFDAVLDALDARGLLYPCWCSRKEVRMAARAPHASDEGPVYGGTCKPSQCAPLGSFAALPSRKERRPALRIDVASALELMGEETLNYEDEVAGPQTIDLMASMGDFVVRRVDGIAAYQVACAWDDVAMGCTQVVRGADLLASAARQLLLLRVLDLPQPRYAHVGLVVDAQGQRLAKRDQSVRLRDLRESGMTGTEALRLMARISGLPDTADWDFLTDAFSLSKLTVEPVRLP